MPSFVESRRDASGMLAGSLARRLSAVQTHRTAFCHCRWQGSQATSSKVEDKPVPKDEDASLQILKRPLGVDEPPSTYHKSWREKTVELMDQDVRLSRRKHLFVWLCYFLRQRLLTIPFRIKEATKGYYSDFYATKQHGGKAWVAPRTLIREDVRSLTYSSYA